MKDLEDQISEILSDLFHRLRTPLNSILGFTELLQKEFYGPLNNEQKEFLEIIYRNANELLEILNQTHKKLESKIKENSNAKEL